MKHIQTLGGLAVEAGNEFVGAPHCGVKRVNARFWDGPWQARHHRGICSLGHEEA